LVARLTGGQEVPGSSPGSPTQKARLERLLIGLELYAPKALPKKWNAHAARLHRGVDASAVLSRVECSPYP
jgi:hypothetical protein